MSGSSARLPEPRPDEDVRRTAWATRHAAYLANPYRAAEICCLKHVREPTEDEL